jgi:hypothetical protein
LSLYQGGQESERAFQDRLHNLRLHESLALIEKRPDLAGLPLLKGPDCLLAKPQAKDLQQFSGPLRGALAGAGDMSKGRDPVAHRVVAAVGEGGGFVRARNPQGVKRPIASASAGLERTIATVMQILVPESEAVRQVLVDHLAGIKGPAASQALAKIALLDLSAKLRHRAVEALRGRPREEYREVLLRGLRYVWPPVADHAAEALVVLRHVDVVPRLRELAAAPDPRAPFLDAATNSYLQPELVRINHLRNCMMCHAPSTQSTDLVRGLLPSPREPLPASYYTSSVGNFVRADVTYLRQDFSVTQPADNHGPWPADQRYDYLVRNKPLPPETDIDKLRLHYGRHYPQRDAILYVLQQLSDRE